MWEGKDSLEVRTGCSCCWEKVQEALALEGVSSTDAACLKNEGPRTLTQRVGGLGSFSASS